MLACEGVGREEYRFLESRDETTKPTRNQDAGCRIPNQKHRASAVSISVISIPSHGHGHGPSHIALYND